MLAKRLAACACGKSFYDTPRGWQKLISHTSEGHKWRSVSEQVIASELSISNPAADRASIQTETASVK